MRRNFIRMYVCAAVACIWMFTGCSDKAGEESALSEIEAASEEAARDGADDGVPEKGASEKEAEASIYVHVCGQVHHPGVYELQENSRLYEAITADRGGSRYLFKSGGNTDRRSADLCAVRRRGSGTGGSFAASGGWGRKSKYQYCVQGGINDPHRYRRGKGRGDYQVQRG